MAFHWDDYLTIAKKLQGVTDRNPHGNDVEALQRSAISRAYYSVYHIAVEYAESYHGYQLPGKDAHKEIRKWYKDRAGNMEHQLVGRKLSRLHKDRCDSDYELKDLGNINALLASVILDADEVKAILMK